jgi:hypothetical protein
MKWLPINVSESTRRRNPHLYGALPPLTEQNAGQLKTCHPKRLRQDTKPLMNKLEREFFDHISQQYPNYPRPRAQAKRYRLGNGIWYKTDFTASSWPSEDGPAMETAWEVKGPHAFRGGFENLKVAAGLWPEVQWILVWKEENRWIYQRVLA